MNTGENVIFAARHRRGAWAEQYPPCDLPRHTLTARRYPMTLHRHWPEVEKMLVMVDSFKTPRALWYTDGEFSRRMLNEMGQIEPYKAKGFIAEWPVSEKRDR